jgi:hypothetical protein
MKSNTPLFIGLACVVLAGFSILDYVNPLKFVSSLLWVAAFATLSGLFFFAYLVNGLHAWKWLFPTCIFAALSEIAFIVNVEMINDLWAVVFGLAALIVPLLVGYFINRPDHVNYSVAAFGSV